jgi:uncharacterized membrane protein
MEDLFMSENKALHNILLLTGMVALVLLSLLFDLAITALAEQNAQGGGLEVTLVWLFPLMELIWMLAVVGLVWFFANGGGYSRWISMIYLIVGIFFLYTNPVLFVNELPDSWYVLVQYLSPGTLLFQAGGALAAIGLLSLWFWKKPASTTEADNHEEGKDLEIEAEFLPDGEEA